MPKLKFKVPVTLVTTALGLPGQPHRIEANYEMDVDEQTAAAAKKVYEDRVEVVPDKPAKTPSKEK